MIDSPLVTALWIGALLVLAGGLVKLTATSPRRATARYAARVGADTRVEATPAYR